MMSFTHSNDVGQNYRKNFTHDAEYLKFQVVTVSESQANPSKKIVWVKNDSPFESLLANVSRHMVTDISFFPKGLFAKRIFHRPFAEQPLEADPNPPFSPVFLPRIFIDLRDS